MTSVHFRCGGCRRLNPGSYRLGYTCEAFPKGIPKAIVFGEHDHTKPYRGDGGKSYEPGPGSSDDRAGSSKSTAIPS